MEKESDLADFSVTDIYLPFDSDLYPNDKAVNYSFHDVNVIGEIQSNVGSKIIRCCWRAAASKIDTEYIDPCTNVITGNSFGICDCLWCKRGKEQKGTNGIPAWILYA